MPAMHVVVALATGKKGEIEKQFTEAYKLVQKPDLFDAISKTYRPVGGGDDANERLPNENKNMQHRLSVIVAQTVAKLIEMYDVTFTLDAGNQRATGDIVIPNGPTIRNVPVPTLLFLEKQLVDVRTFIEKMPTPSPDERWTYDGNQDLLASEPTETHRTKKVQKAIVLYPATDKHPAQTQLINEDVIAGYWTTLRYTSRVSMAEKSAAMDRVNVLIDAVKVARETANACEVDERKMGSELLRFVFGPLYKG